MMVRLATKESELSNSSMKRESFKKMARVDIFPGDIHRAGWEAKAEFAIPVQRPESAADTATTCVSSCQRNFTKAGLRSTKI